MINKTPTTVSGNKTNEAKTWSWCEYAISGYECNCVCVCDCVGVGVCMGVYVTVWVWVLMSVCV